MPVRAPSVCESVRPAAIGAAAGKAVGSTASAAAAAADERNPLGAPAAGRAPAAAPTFPQPVNVLARPWAVYWVRPNAIPHGLKTVNSPVVGLNPTTAKA